MKDGYPRRTVLHRGQSLHLHARRGMTVVTVRGAAQIAGAPVCLAEQPVRETFFLHEGQAHVLPATGWIAIYAETDAEVACIAANSKIRALLDGMRAMLRSALHRWRLASGPCEGS